MRRAKWLLTSISFVAVSVAALACAPEAPAGTPVAAEDLCGAIAETVCSADATCCDAHPADCVEEQTSACRAAIQPLVDDPRLGYDPLRGGALVESIRASGATCWDDPVDYDTLVAAFAGTGEVGADCTPRDLHTGSLRISALSCRAGLACRLYLRADGSTEGECAPREDDACSHALDCGAGRFCSLPDHWQPGVWGSCRPLRADGWTCSSDLECESRYCDGTCGPAPAALRCLETGYGDLVLDASPLAFLRFDESSGSRADDATGNAHVGQLSTAATRDAHGAIAVGEPAEADADAGLPDGGTPGASIDDGGAVRFESDDAAVRISAMRELEGAGAMTLEAWFRADDVDAIHPILELSDGTDLGPHVWAFDRGDKIYASFVDEAGEGHSVMSGEGAITAGEWHHVVATWDGTTARLYLDGRRIGETAAAGPLRTDGDLYVGHRPTGDMPVSFRGSIDEVAVYDRALEPAEIARHHDAGTHGELTTRFPLFRWLAP